MEKCVVIKSKHDWDKKHPYTAVCGGIRASFKTKREAETYIEKEMPHKYINPITFNVEDDRCSLVKSEWLGDKKKPYIAICGSKRTSFRSKKDAEAHIKVENKRRKLNRGK